MKQKESKRFLNMHKKLEAAINDYEMIEEGSHVISALSGGKDSSMLLRLLARPKIASVKNFRLTGVFLEQGFPDDDEKKVRLENLCNELGVQFLTEKYDVQKIIADRKEKPCYVCSRQRRMTLFRIADKIGAKTIAFGHHKDDFIETLLMNMIYSNNISTIKPNHFFFGGSYNIIRPMLYIDEKSLKNESEILNMKTFVSGCRWDKVSERKFVKDLLQQIYKRHLGSKRNLFKSMFTYYPEYLLKAPGNDSIYR